MRVIVKSYYYNNDNYKRGFNKNLKLSPYEHIALSSYRNYLQRLPRSKYLNDAKALKKQAINTSDKLLLKKTEIKLKALQHPYIFQEYCQGQRVVKINDEYNYMPTHISLIISPENWKIAKPIYPEAYFRYYYLMFIDSLKQQTKRNSGLWDYYAVYHDDNLNPHIHLVIYQNSIAYKLKPMNSLSKSRQIYNKKVLKAYKNSLNNINKLKVNKNIFNNKVINKLIEVIKTFDTSMLTPKHVFVCNYLLKALNIHINDLKYNKEYKDLYNILCGHHNYYYGIKNKDILNKLNQGLNINNSNEYSLSLLFNLNSKNKTNMAKQFYLNFINQIKTNTNNINNNNNNIKQNIIERRL